MPSAPNEESTPRVQCHYCGYEPEQNETLVDYPKCCPKCGSSSWERLDTTEW